MFVKNFDENISKKMHKLDNKLVSIALYPFAAFFHPKLIWMAYLIVLYSSSMNYKFAILYAGATLVCLICTYILKRMWSRSRPQLEQTLRKPKNFRKKQKNHSMPSGDALQSACFIAVLYYLGLRLDLLIIFHIGVCLGRVYFMCHWFLDTLVGTFIGWVIGRYFFISVQKYSSYILFGYFDI